MAWWSMKQLAAGLLLAVLAKGPAFAQSPAFAADPNALMRRMSSQPWRYGGKLCCARPGILLMALDLPGPDGRIRGEAMSLTPDRHLIATASVTGQWQPQAVPGGHACTLRMAWPTREMVLRGVCSATTLSGRISLRTPPDGWLDGVIHWWGDEQESGEAWMTEATFYQ